MRRVCLLQAVKMDAPFVIVGDRDSVLHLPHSAAQFAVIQGLAIFADDGEEPGPTRAQLEQQEAEIQAATLPKIGEDDDSPIKRALDGVEEPPAEPKRPYGNAPKSAWVRYACEVDENMTAERAEGMTKADLMSRYGERL